MRVRFRTLELLWRASPSLFAAAVAFVLAEGTLPVLALVAMGRPKPAVRTRCR